MHRNTLSDIFQIRIA